LTTLFVGNLAFSTRDADLRALFEPYGRVVSARVAVDRETRRPRVAAVTATVNICAICSRRD